MAKKNQTGAVQGSLYFAYGANMNVDNMAYRCPNAIPLRGMLLKDWELVFRGVADVVERRGATVNGALWLITPQCEASLDRFEGYPHLYIKRYFTMRVNGRNRTVMLYVMKEKSSLLAPVKSYFRTIRKGYQDFGLNTKTLLDAHGKAPKPKIEAQPYIIQPRPKLKISAEDLGLLSDEEFVMLDDGTLDDLYRQKWWDTV